MEKVYVQSVIIELELPGGKTVEGKFTGLAICSPSEWKGIKNKSLGEVFKGIKFTDVAPIDDMISPDSDRHDIVDSLRDELRKEHHNTLTDE